MDVNNRSSVLVELQEQSEYKLNVNIRKGTKITGGFGKTLYKAEWIDDEREDPIVLIEIKNNKQNQEILLYVTLNHSHIIKTYGLVDPNNYRIDSNTVLLLQEYAAAGDLGGLLINKYFIPEQNVLLEIFIQIADAMVYLSKNGIIHGDLACRNVLVFESHPHNRKRNLVKLIDFGLTQHNSKSSNSKIDVPIRYVAREILLSNGQSGYTDKSDVYSFGVFMWEACCFGKMPYDHINNDDEVSQKKLNGERLKQPEKCDPNVWRLMELCWNDKPETRPDFEKIYKQLKHIQDIESSSPYINSFSSLSSNVKGNSLLFPIQYETCHDCNLRYTYYESHQNQCSEQQLTCYKCGQQYRRASFSNHEENCDGSTDSTFQKPSSVQSTHSSFVPNDHIETLLPSFDLFNQNDDYTHPNSWPLITDRSDSNPSLQSNEDIPIYEPRTSIYSDKSSSPEPGRRFRTSSPEPIRIYRTSSPESLKRSETSSPEPIRRFRRSSPENLSRINKIQLPCEICKQLIDESELETHQRKCDAEAQKRVEEKRRKIAQETTIVQIECNSCGQKFSIKGFDNHEKTCASERLNRFRIDLSEPVPTFTKTNFTFKESPSSNESIHLPTGNNDQRNSIIKSGTLKSAPTVIPTSPKDDKENSSKFTKFFSNFFSSKKKK